MRHLVCCQLRGTTQQRLSAVQDQAPGDGGIVCVLAPLPAQDTAIALQHQHHTPVVTQCTVVSEAGSS